MAETGLLQSGRARFEALRSFLPGAARDSAVISACTLISRATGFGRIAMAAAVLGATYFSNLFQATTLLPQILFELLAGTLLTALLVPPLVARLERGDEAGARRLAGHVLMLVILAFASVATLLIATTPLWVHFLTLGIPEAERAQARHVSTLFVMLMLPQVVLQGIGAVCIAGQQARRSFAIPAAAPAIENVGIITTLALSVMLFQGEEEIGAVTDAHVIFLAVGVTLSVAVHALVQWLGAWRAGMLPLPRTGVIDDEIRTLLRMVPASMGGTASLAARTFALVALAGAVPGGVIALRLAQVLVQLPVALVASPVAVALLPRLARVSRTVDGRREFRTQYEQGVRAILTLAVPAALGLVVLSGPIARAISFGRMANDEAVTVITVAVAAFGLSVVWEALFEISRPAAYSLRDARGPLLASGLRLTLIAPTILVATMTDGALRLAVICAGAMLADAVSALILDARVRHAAPGGSPRTYVLATGVAALLAVAAAMAVAEGVWLLAPSPIGAVLSICGACLAGAVGYGLARYLIPTPRRLEAGES